MQSFTEGYVTEFGYTYGYYAELNPLRAALPILRQGAAMPPIKTACELGFGQGISINIHAAAQDIQWYGTDFNPRQVNFARSLADACKSKADLANEAFAQFCRRQNLPMFDFIGLHGIWSWINDANKAAIVDLVKNKLAVGGILYISYNCYPGWSPMFPVRELLTLYEEKSTSGLKGGIDAAIDFAGRLADLDAIYMRSQPGIKKRLDAIRKQNHVYLAHEYFNKEWDVMSFAKIAEWLEPAMLDYICQANYLDTVNAINYTNDQLELLNSIDNIALRETTADFMVNRQFRRDYWIKGRRQLNSSEQRDQLLALEFIMPVKRDSVELKVKGARIDANLNADVYNPVLDAFADNMPHALADVAKIVHTKGVHLAQLLEAVTILCGNSALAPAQEPSRNVREHCKLLNCKIENISRASGDISFLASPVTGGGTQINRFGQLFLLAQKGGLRQPQDWGQFAWEQLAQTGQRIIKDGKTLQTPEENLAELKEHATQFAANRLPVLEKLGINSAPILRAN